MCRKTLTLMVTKSVDWKSDRFDARSKIEALHWKDQKRPVICLLRAKLFWNRTYPYPYFQHDNTYKGQYIHPQDLI